MMLRDRVLAIGAMSALGLAACGGSTTPTATSPSAPVVAAPSISGTISYTGSALAAHKIIVVVLKAGSTGAPAYSQVLTAAGPYTVANVAAGKYTVFAFIDTGDDMGAPLSSEPQGSYDANADGTPDEFTVAAGSSGATGIDISLNARG